MESLFIVIRVESRGLIGWEGGGLKTFMCEIDKMHAWLRIAIFIAIANPLARKSILSHFSNTLAAL